MGTPRRVQKTSALAHKRGGRRSNHHTLKVCPFLVLFPKVFLFRTSFCTVWQPHLRAPLCCTCFAEVYVYKEVRSLIRCPYLHRFFVQLAASMLGDAPACNVLLHGCEATAIS